MNIIILGSNGMLGSMLYYVGKNEGNIIIPVTRDTFNALYDNIYKLNSFITDNCCIVNCIGAIPQKKYTNDEFHILNSKFPQELAKMCNEKNIPLIHISTNCVFNGYSDKYTELDIPNAEDVYGKSKYLGEPTICTVLRCSIIGPETGTSFGLMEWFLNNENDISGYTDHFWNGLTTLELSRIILDIINSKQFKIGIQHLYSEKTVSKYELLTTIKNIWNKSNTIHPINNGVKYYTLSSQYNTPRNDITIQLLELYQQWDSIKTNRLP